MAELGLEDFLGYETTSRGGGKFLSKWKKRQPPEVRVWLHTRCGFTTLWQHGIPELRVFEDRDTKEQVRKIWGGNWNCFSAETRFWADGRLTSFAELEPGQSVEVLAKDGVWRPAVVKSFGVQALRRVVFEFRGSNASLEFVATPDHRWFTKRGEVTDLKPGDAVLIEPAPRGRSPEHEQGFVHGFIFGDGFRAHKRVGVFSVRLCGAKASHQARLEATAGHATTSYPPSYDGDPILHLKAPLGVDYKSLPGDETPLTYQAGFLEGWMAADAQKKGSHGSPSRYLYSTDDAALEWVSERAPLLGFAVTGRSTAANMETNYGRRNKAVHSLSLRPEAVEYKVREIIDEGRVEEVFCVVEPVTGSFTLEGGVVTGNCLEPDAVLQYQNKRTNGLRDVPPSTCPLCLLMEHVRQQINSGKLTRATPIFRFEVPKLPGDDSEVNRDSLQVLHAGGFSDMLKGTLGEKDLKALRAANISLRDAWQENVRAKCNFVFRVVDNDNLEDGVQIAIEGSLVGEKVQQVIRDQIKRLGAAEGNPLLNPYAFQWEHHPKQVEFQKKYHVLDLSTKVCPMTDAVRALIVDEDPPKIDKLIRPGNVRTLRAQLENAALVEFPWDQLFKPGEALQANMQQDDEPDTSFDYGANELDQAIADADAAMQTGTGKVQAQVAATVVPPQPVAASAPAVVAPPAAQAAPATTRRRAVAPPPPEPMGDPCDECQAPMKVGQLKCTGCGTEYQDVPAPAEAAKPQPAGTVLGADGVVAGSADDKLKW